jgi:hypothetical protein
VDLAVITLDSGRVLELTELHVSSTYGGWMEGVPTPSDNDRIIERLRDKGIEMFGAWPVHVVDGPRTPRPRQGSYRPHEQLPGVTCIGRFESVALHPAPHALMPSSNAIIAWFQNDFSAVFGVDAQARLRAVQWEQFAKDGDW